MAAQRNDPCPCGSGKKYKKCCIDKDLNKDLRTPSSAPANRKTSPSDHLQAGFAAHQAGELDRAANEYASVLASEPKNPNALHLLGVVRMQQERYSEAIELLQQTVALHGEQRDFLYNLGNALRGARRDKEAISVYQRLLARHPKDIDTLNNLGLAYRNLHQPRDAHACFVAAQKLAPGDADLIINIGLALFELNQPDEAIARYQEALKLAPGRAEVWNNFGTALQQTGDAPAAEQMLAKAIALRPDYPEALSNYAFCLDFIESSGAAAQQAARKRWAERCTHKITPFSTFANPPTPERPLRIGYVSADFRQHSAAYAFGAMLLYRNTEVFHVELFSNSPTRDALTERFIAATDAWHEIYGLSDADAAALIQSRAIDILIDLSGHSKDNRLGIFARRPAPVQLSGWGHANGTGLSTVDYLLADEIYIPPHDAVHYAEKVRYLPCTLGYFPQSEAPPVTPLPMAANGYVTFGAFSRLSKVSPETLEKWCELLHTMPTSRLIVKAPELNSPERQAKLRQYFDAAGLGSKRVQLLGGSPWFEHLQVIAQSDIVLDPFPHGGGVTVLDCLWMGVPVMTINCPIPTGRLAAAILHSMGMGDWVANSVAELIPKLKDQLSNPAALATLRQTLRQRMLDSTVGNPHRYVAAVENEYRAIWREWCEKQ